VPPAAESLAATTNYRARWLGVYDQLTGEPIEGVRVLDLNTGNSTLTSVLGAVNLIYLADGANLVSMQKIGYEQIRMAIAIGPRVTVPLTVLMRRITELPKVVTASEAQSTHRSPLLCGFDDRRRNAVTGSELHVGRSAAAGLSRWRCARATYGFAVEPAQQRCAAVRSLAIRRRRARCDRVVSRQ
jgi:hypothetical protein